MAKFVAKNVVKETTATTGTGTYVLAGAVTGYDPFSVVGTGSKVSYKCEDAAGSIKEVGIGTFTVSPNQVTRDEIIRSPSGSAVSWGAGTKTITLVCPAELLKLTAVSPGPFNCRLEFVSATQIALNRYQGANLPLVSAGIFRDRQIPSAGVTLANTGLTANTEYNIYAFWTGSAINLEASTTAHAGDADTGVEIKSGDSTRLFVGRVKVQGSTPGQFQSDDANRMVASWFNPIPQRLKAALTADRTTTSTTYVLLNVEIMVNFMAIHGFAEAASAGSFFGSANATRSNLSLDGAVPSDEGGSATTATGVRATLSNKVVEDALSEGAHSIALHGRTASGTGTWEGTSGSVKCAIFGHVLG